AGTGEFGILNHSSHQAVVVKGGREIFGDQGSGENLVGIVEGSGGGKVGTCRLESGGSEQHSSHTGQAGGLEEVAACYELLEIGGIRPDTLCLCRPRPQF